jgi:predicted Fe-Mo cluster-binding NifX family protein
MTQTVAIPLFGNRVSSRFDCSKSILLVAIDDGTIIRRQEMRWTSASILERIHLLLEESVAVLICGGITDTCAHLLQDNNIEVIPWVRGEVEEVLFRFMQGTLRTIVAGGNNGRSS